jgi:hypothetical protein
MQITTSGATVELPDEIPGIPCAGGFVFGLYKSGSTMLHGAVRRLARATQTKQVDVIHSFHGGGIHLEKAEFSEAEKAALEHWMGRPGILYSGWRQFPLNYRLPLRPETHTFLLIRDPRDILTSHYFSLRYSHPVRGPSGSDILKSRQHLQTTGIDAFALSAAKQIEGYFRAYDALAGTNLMLRRYEDVIFDKPKLIADLCSHFGISAPRPRLERIAKGIDQRPAAEDVSAHIRQVTPGDHKKKLQPETIEQLNALLADILSKHGYTTNT